MTSPVPQPGLFPAELYPTEVLLVRHGRSADVVPGSPESEDPPLHEQGVTQASALAERLAVKQLTAIYASEALRARDTALAVGRRLGIDVSVEPTLREVHLGEWEHGEFRRRAAVRDPHWVRFSESGRWEDIPGAERDADFRSRVVGAIDGIAAKHAGHSVLVVCHAGVINAYLAEVLGIARSTFTVIENTSVTLVRHGEGRRIILAVNDTHHLYDPVLGLPG